MKIPVIAISLCLVVSALGKENNNPGTIGNFKKGLAASLILTNGDDGQWTASSERAFYPVLYYYMGFIHGINASYFFERDGSELSIPTEDMLNVSKQAPFILAFITKYKIPDSARTRNVLLAWYLQAHPKATPLSRSMSEEFIKDSVISVSRSLR